MLRKRQQAWSYRDLRERVQKPGLLWQRALVLQLL